MLGTGTIARPAPTLLLVAGLLMAAGLLAAPAAASGQEQAEDAAGFQAFSERVDAFVRLHKSVEATLPRLKPTDLPEMISAHQQALARKIREARPGARLGDIFTHEAREAFRHAIRSEYKSSHAARALATMQQAAPAKELRLRVNQVSPGAVPDAGVPPTLLLRFPKLPDEVAYRIAGRDLVLLDVNANLVVDLIRKAIPE